MTKNYSNHINHKICEHTSDAQKKVEGWKEEGKRVVFTNGCFDLLHPGHVSYLMEARSCGDRLIIGLNSDKSVRKLKGEQRPLNSLQVRALMLASLQMVDLVVPFGQATPLELILALKPDVLVKGGDYEIHEIVGADEVQQWGGEVKRLSFVKGYSTTSLIHKIKEL